MLNADVLKSRKSNEIVLNADILRSKKSMVIVLCSQVQKEHPGKGLWQKNLQTN